MRQYVEKMLHTAIQQDEFHDAMPLYLKEHYRFEKWQIHEISMLVAYPIGHIGVVALHKHKNKLESLFDMPILFAFEQSSRYKIAKMKEESIPFILNKQIVFLPFLGMALNQKKMRKVPEINKLSISAQKFVLLTIYERWVRLTMPELAERLGVSRMTASRILDEMEAIDPRFVFKEGKLRIFNRFCEPEIFWNTLQPFLFNPVMREYRLEACQTEQGFMKGGLSALSRYSMISDNEYPTFSTTRENEELLALKKRVQLPREETPDCVIQITKYQINFGDNKTVDPLSVILSLSEQEKKDIRVEGEVEKLLEEVLKA
ncbi:MarR family transcriptional regulator [Saccharibacillus sacchari]|uniref:MarR family transcriptional regulator n=1 Tax=Saccharibacillus sacchari TaxID=456493 RepID=A0ACC6PIF0_9BACL